MAGVMGVMGVQVWERIVHNVTVALRCVDGNSRRVLLAPVVSTAGAGDFALLRNRSGDTVVIDRTGLAAITVTVADPTSAYLPRRATVALPRDPDPAHAAAANSLFRPAELALYPAPSAQAAPGWAVIRATVVSAANGSPLGGALLRVTRASDNAIIARGVSDWRGRAAGEALVAVPGVPAITFGAANGPGDDGAVLVSTIAVNVEVIYDPQQPGTDGQPPDPDDLEARASQLSRSVVAASVGAGAATAVRVTV